MQGIIKVIFVCEKKCVILQSQKFNDMRRIFTYICAAVLLAAPLRARGTGQIPDIMVVDGDTMLLLCNPLDGYFDEAHPRPADMYGMGSTACWRAYQAYWEIRSDSLFLTGIRLGERGDSSDFYPLERLFGDKASARGVFACWVNGNLRSAKGRMLYYVHLGYERVYEYDILYKVKAGKVRRKRIYDNTPTFLPCNHAVCDDAPGGSLLERYASSQIDYGRLGAEDRCGLVEVEVKRVDARGRIRRAEAYGATRRQEREVLRAVKKIPCYGVLYVKGKPMKELGGSLNVWVYGNADSARNSLRQGGDVGSYSKAKLSEGVNPVRNLKWLYEGYKEAYDGMAKFIADTSERAMRYKAYYAELFGDTSALRSHYYMTMADSALKYMYQYWDWTDEHEKLYPEIVELEQRLGRPHNPKIIDEPDKPFEYLLTTEDLDEHNTAKAEDLERRCRQVSYHLRGFGEGSLRDPLPQGVQEEWRLLILRGSRSRGTSPVLVKVLYDGTEAQIEWRVAKEGGYETYPGKDRFRHGIRSEGRRTLRPEEWQRLLALADTAGLDTVRLPNDFFTSPPAIYNVEHRTHSGYRVLNDYNHPYYTENIDPRFWFYRAFCKYLLSLADKELPFDVDDERYR